MHHTVPERFHPFGMRHGLHEQRQSVGKNRWWLSAAAADRMPVSESVPVLRMLADEQSLHPSEQQPVPERTCLHRFSGLRTEQHSSDKQRFPVDVLRRESVSVRSVRSAFPQHMQSATALLPRACVHWLWYTERAAVSRMCSERSVLHAGSVLPAGKGFCHSDSSRCSCR